ncbi:MAG: MerR family transcriptional regulator [Lentilitoribacter sp.]
MQIGEFSKHSGLSIDTIRYYEKIGLMPLPLRDGGGRRIYRDDHLVWADFLDVLKSTGMGVKDMASYVELRAGGAQSIPERLELLTKHHLKVRAEIKRLQDVDAVLSEKITTFKAVLSGEIDGDSLTCKKDR